MWVALLFAIILSLAKTINRFANNDPSLRPCVFISGEEYRVATQAEAAMSKDSINCLSANDIPPEVYKNALNYLAQKSGAQVGGGVAGIVVLNYILFFAFFFYVIRALAMAHIRLNGLKITNSQYEIFYKIYEATAKELGLRTIPSAYIIHAGGSLNAFAIKITGRAMVVFYADLIEALVEGDKFDELRAIAAHELAHIRLRHVNSLFFLLPFHVFPFLGSMLSRAQEFSADKAAFEILKDHHVVARALVKLVTGKYLSSIVDIDEYIRQAEEERGIFIWLSKVTSSHPPVPYRIKALKKMANS